MSPRRPIKIDPGLAAIIAAVITSTIAAIAAIVVAIINKVDIGGSTPSSPSDSDYSESSDISDGVISTVSSESLEESSIPSESPSNSSLSSLNNSIDDTQPSESSSDSETSTTSDSSIPEMPRTFEHYRAKAVLYSPNSGEAYIYKEFLEENYVDKIIDNKYKLLGWLIDFHTDGQSVKFRVFPSQDGYYNFEVEAPNMFVDKNKIRSFISAELLTNGDLKISFNFRSNSIDLSSTYGITPGTVIQEINY